MIYFLRLANGAIKIGYTANPDERFRDLAKHYKGEITVLKTVDGNKTTERELHQRFSHLRFNRLEQFRPERDLLEFIGLSDQIDIPDEPNPLADGTVLVLFKLPEDLIKRIRHEAAERGVYPAKVVAERLGESYRRTPPETV